MANDINIIYPYVDETAWQYGITKWLPLDLSHDSIRMLISSPSGGGKTTLAKSLLAKAAAHTDSIIFVLDYKNTDFAFLNGAAHYFSYNQCTEGFEQVYQIFEYRLSQSHTFPHLIFFIDEYQAWILSFNSKEQKELMSKIARLLHMSRSKQLSLIFSCQKPLNELFASGARESFSHKLVLANPSKETINMIMPTYKDEIHPCPTGVGYLTVNDASLTKIRVAYPKNIEKLQDDLFQGVNRPLV